MNLTPPIGAAGRWNVKPPFNALVNASISYQCMAVRKLADILALGVNVLETYYSPHGLTEDIYQTDLETDTCILSLYGSDGTWVYVPNSYLTSYPEVDGVLYNNLALMVTLGALPDSADLGFLKTQIQGMVTNLVGVSSEVMTVVIAGQTIVSYEAHETYEAARQNTMEMSTTDYSRQVSLEAENTALRDRIAQLEAYILEQQPTP